MACNCGKDTPKRWGSGATVITGAASKTRVCAKCGGALVPLLTKWKCSRCGLDIQKN